MQISLGGLDLEGLKVPKIRLLGFWQKSYPFSYAFLLHHEVLKVVFSYPAFFELVWLTLAPINIYIIYRSNIYMAPIYIYNTRSNK